MSSEFTGSPQAASIAFQGKASAAGQVSMQITHYMFSIQKGTSEQRAFEKLLHVSLRLLLYPATCFCCNFQQALKRLGNRRHPRETSATLLQHGPSVLWAVSSQPFHHMPISKDNKVRYAIYSCWTTSQFPVHVNHFDPCKTEAKSIKNAKHSGNLHCCNKVSCSLQGRNV